MFNTSCDNYSRFIKCLTRRAIATVESVKCLTRRAIATLGLLNV